MQEMPSSLRLARFLLAAHALGTLAYWIGFAAIPAIRLSGDAAYLAFERAFPPADAGMALCAVAAAVAISRRREAALLLGSVAAGAMGFLAALDLAYALQQAQYAVWRPAMAIHLGVVSSSAVLAAGIPLLLWRGRGWLRAPSDLRDTGERVVPAFVSERDAVAVGLLEQHLARYRFAARFAKDARTADVACGAGYGTRMLAEAGAAEIFAMDLDPAAVAYAAEHFADPSVAFRAGDAGRLSDWGSRRFDLIVSLETLEHVSDVDAYFRALDAALAPGGLLVLSASVVPTRDLYAFHLRDYDADSLRSELAAHGFSVVEEFPLEHHFSPREMRGSLRHHPSTVPASALVRRPLHYLRLAARTYFSAGLRHASLTLACRRTSDCQSHHDSL